MKKLTFLALAASAIVLHGCGTAVSALTTLGQVASATQTVSTDGTTTNQTQTIGNILQSVLGGGTLTQKSLVGTWTYSQPGCAFTSEKLLAQAGGEVVAAEIKAKLQPTYQKIGVKSSNTQVTFNADGTYAATFAGKQMSGNYTFDEATSKVTMQGLLLSISCYAKKNADGIGLLFESSKLLTLLQTVSALSGNASMQTVGDLAKNYDGLRLGFDFK